VWTALLAPTGEEERQAGWERGEEDGEQRGKMRRKNDQRGERWLGKSREKNLWGVAAILFRSAAGRALFWQR
jgi:hypothetical protein